MTQNGHQMPGMPPANPNGQQLTAEQLQGLNIQLQQIIGTMIRGILVSAPGVPPHALAGIIAFQIAHITAQAIEGDAVTLIRIRKMMRDAFDDGIKKTPMVDPAAQKLAGQADRLKSS